MCLSQTTLDTFLYTIFTNINSCGIDFKVLKVAELYVFTAAQKSVIFVVCK